MILVDLVVLVRRIFIAGDGSFLHAIVICAGFSWRWFFPPCYFGGHSIAGDVFSSMLVVMLMRFWLEVFLLYALDSIVILQLEMMSSSMPVLEVIE